MTGSPAASRKRRLCATVRSFTLKISGRLRRDSHNCVLAAGHDLVSDVRLDRAKRRRHNQNRRRYIAVFATVWMAIMAVSNTARSQPSSVNVNQTVEYDPETLNWPSPSDLWVFMDEHPDSINDGLFDFAMPTSPSDTHYVDMPASYHDDACAFAFADGHAELHKWLYPGVFPLVDWNVQDTPTPIKQQSSNVPNNPDFMWLAAHTTARLSP